MAEERSSRTKDLADEGDCLLPRPGYWAAFWYEGNHLWHKRLLLYPSSKNKGECICARPDPEEDCVCEDVVLESSPDDWAVAAYGFTRFNDSPQPSNHFVYEFDPVPSLGDSRGWMKGAIKYAR